MPINRVVVNASPLICLFKSGLADLLPALFKEVIAPEEVCHEIAAKGKGDRGRGDGVTPTRTLPANWKTISSRISGSSSIGANSAALKSVSSTTTSSTGPITSNTRAKEAELLEADPKL